MSFLYLFDVLIVFKLKNVVKKKVLIKTPGISGYDLSKLLYEEFNIEDERTNEKSTMLLCGIGTDNKKLDLLQKVLMKL